MKFIVIPRDKIIPKNEKNTSYLKIDYWNDYSFVTMFHLYVYDSNGTFHDIGNIKIGFKGQSVEISTYKKLETTFSKLPSDFFPLV
ncbi:hypothetical protein [Aeromonas sp. 604534]|uniref:hypothetical protein n=1 Tax=Aeromonas sp. 604534 TaxID=2712055 RepID=UPI003BA2EA65